MMRMVSIQDVEAEERPARCLKTKEIMAAPKIPSLKPRVQTSAYVATEERPRSAMKANIALAAPTIHQFLRANGGERPIHNAKANHGMAAPKIPSPIQMLKSKLPVATEERSTPGLKAKSFVAAPSLPSPTTSLKASLALATATPAPQTLGWKT